jgi:hypothetical protein
MPIYDIFASKETESFDSSVEEIPVLDSKKDRFFSSMTTRVLFFLLLIGDIVWVTWSLLKISLVLPGFILIGGRSVTLQTMLGKAWLALKRGCVCGMSLLIALFSPALGIMIVCTYFLMYDKTGIQAVVPRSLQDQFQEFLKETK